MWRMGLKSCGRWGRAGSSSRRTNHSCRLCLFEKEAFDGRVYVSHCHVVIVSAEVPLGLRMRGADARNRPLTHNRACTTQRASSVRRYLVLSLASSRAVKTSLARRAKLEV